MKTLILLLFPLSLLAQVTVTKVSDSTYLLTVKPIIKTDTVWLPSLPEPAAGTLIYSINSGGPGDRGFTGGATFARGNLKAPYNTERWGNLSYNLPANGKYEVVLKFAEIFHTAANRRRFNVTVENQLIKSNWDIFAEHGSDTVHVRAQATVIDGQLTISLQGVLDNAKISGFDIFRLDSIPFQTGGQIPPSDGCPVTTTGQYYLTTTGTDTGNCSQNPCRTLAYAVSRGPGTVIIGAGTFRTGQVSIPAGVNLEGAGIDKTIIVSNLHSPAGSWYQTSGNYGFERTLLKLEGAGKNTIRNLTIDGDQFKARLGVFAKERTIEVCQIKALNFNWVDIQLLNSHKSIIEHSIFRNSSWSQSSGSSGNIQISRVDDLIIRHCDFNEHKGYAIKAAGEYDRGGPIRNFDIHDNRLSVTPRSTWNGDTPNIAVELWQADLHNCKFRNNYIDGVLSLVLTRDWFQTHPPQRLLVEGNTFDLIARQNNRGFCVEVGMANVEMRGNYFRGGFSSFLWTGPFTIPGINIHDNYFYINNVSRSEVFSIRYGQLMNPRFVNNTVHLDPAATNHIVFRGQTHVNGRITGLTANRNLFLFQGNVQQLSENTNAVITANFFQGMTAPINNYATWLSGTTYSKGQKVKKNNKEFESLTSNNRGNDPEISGPSWENITNVSGTAPIQKTGARPLPYYSTPVSFVYGAKTVN